jgi:hypothetical protein
MHENTGILIQGKFIDEKQFSKLVNGDIFPGVIDDGKFNHWWEDFPDVYQLRSVSENNAYKEKYGEEFLAAQAIVRTMLEKDPIEKKKAQNIEFQKGGLQETTIHERVRHDG